MNVGINLSLSQKLKNTFLSIFESKIDASSQEQPFPWKILILDYKTQDIVSPLFKLAELRQAGVALNLNICSDRDVIPTGSAIYIIEPTDENVSRLCQDIQESLYSEFCLHFTNSISHVLLKRIAETCLLHPNSPLIRRVCDNFCNFICLEDDLFTMRTYHSPELKYSHLNSRIKPDSEIEAAIDAISDSLLSVLVTMSAIPYIASVNSPMAQMLAGKLTEKIVNFLSDSKNNTLFSSFASMFGNKRPVLIIYDRNHDVATMLHHSWTYQALCHDLFSLTSNRIQLSVKDKKDETKKESLVKYHFDSDSDFFWQKHRHSTFPVIAEEIQNELSKYNEDRKKMPQAGDTTMDSFEQFNSNKPTAPNFASAAHELIEAMANLPALTARKYYIDNHMQIIWSILDNLKIRSLDALFAEEESMLKKNSPHQYNLNLIRGDNAKGNTNDRLRLYMIIILTSNVSDTDHKSMKEYFISLNVDTQCLDYLFKLKLLRNISSVSDNNNSQYNSSHSTKQAALLVSNNPSTTSPQHFLSQGQNALSSFSTSLLKTGTEFLKKSPLNIIQSGLKLPITKITESIIENKAVPEWSSIHWYDPKSLSRSPIVKPTTVFSDAIVFVAGGGNYVEYLNLIDIKKKDSNSHCHIYYGTTEMTNSEQFIDQLNILSKE